MATQAQIIANRFFETVARINEGPLKEYREDFGGNRGKKEDSNSKPVLPITNHRSPKDVKRNQFPKGKN